MNETEIKAVLLQIREAPDFEVQLTGKRSRRTHGKYYPHDHLIKINDLNYVRDSSLMYTAIHEYAHHVEYCEHQNLAHNRHFWATFHNLLDVAIEKELCSPPPTNDKIEEIETDLRKMLTQHAKLEADIANRIRDLFSECDELSIDPEYEIERKLKLSHNGHARFMKTEEGMRELAPGEYRNAEQAAAIASGGVDTELAIKQGKTIEQSKTIERPQLDPYEKLKKLHATITTRIERLSARKASIETKMRQMELQFGDEAAS